MVDPDRQRLSPSIGDYLKAIWAVAGTGVASTKDVSERLSITPASVTNMFARLRDMGLVGYERYKGASLTEEGRIEAQRLLRRHRLIETFLLEHLGYSWQEVHEEAESLEHTISDTFTERLAELLGHPERSPYGHPIPETDGALPLERSYPLSKATVGCRVRVSKVSDAPLSRSYATRTMSRSRANIFVTDAAVIERRSETSFVEATPVPPTAQMAFR